MRRVRAGLLAGVALVACGAAVGYGGFRAYTAAGPAVQASDVTVPRGSFAAVAQRLHAAGVVRSAWALRGFELATRWQGAVRAAEYSFPAGASVQTVLLILRHGRPVQHLVTVPEGVTAARVGRILADAGGLSGAIVVPDEGGFLPESYAFEQGASEEALLRRGRASMQDLVGRQWASRTPGLPLRSARDLLVLASLVERETHLAAERGLVAGVFVNRLRLGMRLQADSSVEYGASGGIGELGHGLRRDELDAAGPYNTYARPGLPAGPICNPGAAALAAAAHPAATDALYFVADGSGGHVFARALDEHAANVARYRRLGR